MRLKLESACDKSATISRLGVSRWPLKETRGAADFYTPVIIIKFFCSLEKPMKLVKK
jgi:hypothetical protein